MNTKFVPIVALGLAIAGAAAVTPASAMPVTPFVHSPSATPVQYYYDDDYAYRRRPRITVYPSYQGNLYFDDLSQYPYARGFEDHNPVPRGNMRGCSVDLGYGRYESCDK